MSDLRAAAQQALDLLTMNAKEYRDKYGDEASRRDGDLIDSLTAALAAPQPEPSAGLREAAEWLVRDALTYFPHADSVKAVQHALAAAPSPALSVERLARAFDLNDVNWPKRWGDNDFAWLARQVATEYDRLTAEDAP